MVFEADLTQITLTELADRAAQSNSSDPSSRTVLGGLLSDAVELAKNAVETAQAISSLLQESVSVVEDLGASAYDVVNELALTLENPFSTEADTSTSGSALPTSKSDPQKDCGGFKLVSNLLNEVNELSSELSYQVEVQVPALSNFNFTAKHLMSYAYNGLLNQFTNINALVDEVLSLADQISSIMDNRNFVALEKNDSTSKELVQTIQDFVLAAKGDVNSLYSRYKTSVVFDNGEWLSALDNVTKAKDTLEENLGNFEGEAGSYYGVSNLKVIDLANLMREKVCFLERATNAVNTTTEGLVTVQNSQICFPIEANTGSVIDRIRCHLENINTELEKMKTAGVLTINMNAAKQQQVLAGLIIFMENSTDILRGLTTPTSADKLNTPDDADLATLYDNEKNFKESCYAFIGEALSLSVSSRGTTRLDALHTVIKETAPGVKEYGDVFGSLVDIDDETVQEAIEVVDTVVRVFSDPGIRADILNGNLMSATSRLGYGLISQRYLYVATFLEDFKLKSKLETQANQRKYKRMREAIDGVYLKKTLDLSLGTDRQSRRKTLLGEYQSYYNVVLNYLKKNTKRLQDVSDAISKGRSYFNDYRAKLANFVAGPQVPDRGGACPRHIK